MTNLGPKSEQDRNRSFADYQRGAEVRDKYCKSCKYNLRGLMSGVCPECGLPFSLTNPRSYLASDEVSSPRIGGLGIKRRVRLFGGSLLLAWVIPYGLVFLIASTLGPSGSGQSDFAVLGCCGYVILYPITLPLASFWMANALLPEGWSGVSFNILVASLIAGILITGQLIFVVAGFSPLMLLLGLIIGVPTGLYRARWQT